jgi:hypothetical protein
MRKTRLFALVAVLVVAAILTVSLASVAGAQTGGGYDLTWSTVDGGGGSSSGGAYTLDGTIGQADAGSSSGGGYSLAGGFWAGVAAALYSVFLPLISK